LFFFYQSSDHPPPPLGLLLQEGKTPLYSAAKYGHKEVVGLLLGAGAAVDAADKVRPRPNNYMADGGDLRYTAAGTRRC
jgi:ankyrin repeat protein